MTLVDEIVTAARAPIASAVEAGTITRAQADERLADLQSGTTS